MKDVLPSEMSILVGLGERLTQARIARSFTQKALADAAGVSKRTIERLETGKSVQLSNLVRVLIALDFARNFEELIPGMVPRPMDLLRHQGKTRKRAFTIKPVPTEPWSWDDKRS